MSDTGWLNVSRLWVIPSVRGSPWGCRSIPSRRDARTSSNVVVTMGMVTTMVNAEGSQEAAADEVETTDLLTGRKDLTQEAKCGIVINR
jgi:hypothetical protein